MTVNMQGPHCHVSFLILHMVYISLQCVLRHLERQVRDDAGDSEADQKQVGENEGSGGVDDLLDLFVRPTGLTGLPGEKQRRKTVRLDSCFVLCYLSQRTFMHLFSPLGNFVILVLAVFELPVHDVANHRRGDQTQKLEHAKDGCVDTH